MENKKLTVCFFGIYNPEYSRNRVLINGLKENGVEVLECRTSKKNLIKYFDLIKKHWKIRNQYDVLFVAFPGFQSMILARFLTGKKIVYDSFTSIYDSEVNDRKNTKKGSLKAKYFWFLDWLSCKLANKILLDTNENIKYYISEFGIKKEKFERVFVGTDTSIFRPKEKIKYNNKFIVHFHGSNIPLQGVDCVLESAKLLEREKDIQFNIVGSNIKKEYEGNGFENINFMENVPYTELPNYINKADICLGIFGDTEKAQRVIPNKVFECVACEKAVITLDTPAIRELFDENDLCLIFSDSVEELVQAILDLKNNPEKIDYLAQNGYNRLIQNVKIKKLGSQLKETSLSLLQK